MNIDNLSELTAEGRETYQRLLNGGKGNDGMLYIRLIYSIRSVGSNSSVIDRIPLANILNTHIAKADGDYKAYGDVDKIKPNTSYKIIAQVAPFEFGNPANLKLIYTQPALALSSGLMSTEIMPILKTDNDGKFIIDPKPLTALYAVYNPTDAAISPCEHWLVLYLFETNE